MKALCVFMLIIFSQVVCYPQSKSYGNGNGTVADVKVNNKYTLVVRRHEQSLQLGNLAKEQNLAVRMEPSMDSKIVGRLKIGDYIHIKQEAEETYENDYINVWLNITAKENISGWILFGKFTFDYAKHSVPYFNDRWEIEGVIKGNNRDWTVRKMVYQLVAVEEVLNIRDKPGVTGTRVISKIVPPREGNRLVTLNVTAVTEEEETIDGRTDRWLKTTYNGVEGWVFGGYTGVERGGPKYYIPDDMIYYDLIDGP